MLLLLSFELHVLLALVCIFLLLKCRVGVGAESRFVHHLVQTQPAALLAAATLCLVPGLRLVSSLHFQPWGLAGEEKGTRSPSAPPSHAAQLLCSLHPGSAGEGRALWLPPSHHCNPGAGRRWLQCRGLLYSSPPAVTHLKVISASWAVQGDPGVEGRLNK